MKTAFKEEEPVHLGNNVQRIREIIGIKQYALAEECQWSQQQMSKLENSEHIDDGTLEIIAAKLGVTSEFIRSFKEERAIYNIQNNNTFHDNASTQHYRPTISNDPADQIVKLLEKFIQDDQKKTQSIAELSKAVLDLAEEVKKLKEAGK